MCIEFGAAAFPEPDRAWLRKAEKLPIASLWHGGHVLPPAATGEAITRLALLVAWTEWVRVGTATLTLPLYHPVMAAKQIADLDAHAGGRIVLGVGAGGEFPAEFDALGVPLDERASRTDEAISVMRALWSGAEVNQPGPHFPLQRAQLRVALPPSSPISPPIVISGRKGAAMRRAARIGDGWMPYLLSPEAYARSVETIRGEAAATGRGLARFEWMAFVYCSIRADGARARDEARRFLGKAYGDMPDAQFARLVPAGTPDEVAPAFQAYVDAGVRHFIIAPATHDDTLDVVRLATQEVLPRLHLPEPVPA